MSTFDWGTIDARKDLEAFLRLCEDGKKHENRALFEVKCEQVSANHEHWSFAVAENRSRSDEECSALVNLRVNCEAKNSQAA